MRRGIALALLALVATQIVVAPADAAGGPSQLRAPELRILEQTLTVASNGTLTISLQLPTMDDATRADAHVVVTAYRRVSTRDAVHDAIDGDLPQALDAVDTPLSELTPGAQGEVSISMPIETNRRTPDGLQLSNAGLYPLVVDVRATGDPISAVVTFVNRLTVDAPPTPDPLPVGLAMAVTEPLTLADDGTVELSSAGTGQLAQLADTLAAAAMPATVRIPARALSALRSTDAALADRLARSLATCTLVSTPSLPLDPSSAAAGGLRDLYTQWLRDGEDVLDDETGTHATRELALVDEKTSAAGGALIRDAGAQTMVLSSTLADELTHRPSATLDTTLLTKVAVDGTQIDGLVVDQRLADLLEHPVGGPALTAVYAVAELLATRMEIIDAGGTPGRHGVLLGLPDLGIPDHAVISELTTLIGATAELSPMSVDGIVADADHQESTGEPVTLELPARAGTDLAPRLALAESVRAEAHVAASLLPLDDPRRAGWDATIGLFPTTALTDAQVDTMAATARADFAAVRGAVRLPKPFKFSLTGRSSTIRFNLQNDSPTPLTVKVRMNSPKLTFPADVQTVVLTPNASTQVAVPVEVRSSGDFGVSLDVLAPADDSPLAPTVPLTASFTAISGLGNFITGAALLILLAWWWRHWRTQRRTALAAASAVRHPATLTEPAEVLSPDAATSTLPPS